MCEDLLFSLSLSHPTVRPIFEDREADSLRGGKTVLPQNLVQWFQNAPEHDDVVPLRLQTK